jgi:WD40 repeat protein
LQLETWLAEFEEGWDEHCLAARVERLPPPGQPLRLPALIELVKIDLERNWQRGRYRSLSDYLARYPELGPAEALPADLLLTEEEVCRQFGEVPATLLATPDGAAASPPILARPSSPAASRVPSVRGYDVLGKIGQGGMGAVYKAHHLRLNRVVALKVVCDAPNARPEDLVRFRQEAELIARLHHANIVQIYEVGEYPGGSYLALEYVDGPGLDRQVNGTPQPPRQAARLVEALARAVHYAHGQGVIHRDLKPANVLLTAAGAPKITDFGLARLVKLESGLTTVGAILGTPSYMAPEQADARPEEVGPHTDTYGLGAILYECLTGRPPFQGATMLETLEQVRKQDPIPPHRLLGSNKRACPADLETICLKCLEKDPPRRYASAGALADDLGRYLAGEPIAARPVGPVGRAWRWARRNPGWAAMLGTVAGLLLVIAVGSSLLTLRLNQTLQETQEEKRKADENLWIALLEQARSKSRSREQGQRFDGLAAIRQALRLPVPPGHSLAELRNEAIACLVLPDVEPAGTWWEGLPPGTLMNIAFDATCERYARLDKDRNVSVRRVADDAELLSWKGPAALRLHSLSFSPDGRFLNDKRDGRFKLRRLDSPEAEVVLENLPDAPPSETEAFSPDGRFFATAQRDKDGSVVVYDLQSAKGVKEVQTLRKAFLPPPLAFVGDSRRLAFAPDSRRLAVAGGNVARVYDWESGKPLGPDLTHPADVNWIAWHPDGRALATTCDDRFIRLWDAAAGKLSLPPLAGHYADGVKAAFNPAGDCLLSKDWAGILRLWDPRTGRQLLQTQGSADVLSRDGDLMAAEWSGSRVRLLRVATRRPLRALAAPGNSADRRLATARVSPDGRLLLVTRSDALAFVDWTSGAELASIPLPGTRVVQFDTTEGLLTSGAAGLLLHWPVRAEPETGRLHVGPPEALFSARMPDRAACSADGQVVALPEYERGVVLHRRENRRVALERREDVRFCAVSPDGRWVATGNHWNSRGIGATVWDARSGQAEHDFPVLGEPCPVGFSLDGRWLLTTGSRFRLWKVGTWEEGPPLTQPDSINGAFAFSPDRRTLALGGGFSQVWLVDVNSGAEIARLTVPDQAPVGPQCFSPDGSQLVAIGVDLLYIWDLRALRAELKELDLDWDRPDYPPAPAAPTRPLQVQVDGGAFYVRREPAASLALYTLATALQPLNPEAHYRRAVALEALNRGSDALAAYGEAIRQQPNHVEAYRARVETYLALGKPAAAVADAQELIKREAASAEWLNSLARRLVTGPAAVRDPAGAVPLAEKAVALEPSVLYRNTLGVAYYRAGHLPEARDCFVKNLEAPQPYSGFDQFFLAMCQQRLGNAAAARDCFDRAVAWRKAQTNLPPSWARELDAFEAEAREALDLPGQAKP